MLESGGAGDLLTMSEPDFFMQLHFRRAEGMFKDSPTSLNELLQAGFRIQCKPTRKNVK